MGATERVGDIRSVGDQQLGPGEVYVLRSRISDRSYGDIDVLHVISSHAGGEIRGYWRPHGEDGPWTVRMPAHAEWPEMDRAVEALVGAPVIDDSATRAAS